MILGVEYPFNISTIDENSPRWTIVYLDSEKLNMIDWKK